MYDFKQMPAAIPGARKLPSMKDMPEPTEEYLHRRCGMGMIGSKPYVEHAGGLSNGSVPGGHLQIPWVGEYAVPIVVDELEGFIDESIKRMRGKRHHPSRFVERRHRHGMVKAMKRPVALRMATRGMTRPVEIDLLDCDLEAAVLKFPGEFTPEEQH